MPTPTPLIIGRGSRAPALSFRNDTGTVVDRAFLVTAILLGKRDGGEAEQRISLWGSVRQPMLELWKRSGARPHPGFVEGSSVRLRSCSSSPAGASV
jgi:hypothetical protein